MLRLQIPVNRVDNIFCFFACFVVVVLFLGGGGHFLTSSQEHSEIKWVSQLAIES